jgi:hypothetical protein
MAKKQSTEPWLAQNLQPGRMLRRYFNPGNINNGTVHVRAIVDGDIVVTREWSRTKQSWRYQTHDRDWYRILREAGQLTAAGKSDDRTPT